mgnify:CR=1 FL=1|jgi:hypothetical protein
MNGQLTMEKILNVALAMKQKGIDLSKIKVFLGNDDELNGIHNAWYCELVENNGEEENNCIVDLINENIGNNVEENEKFILIS